MAHTIHTQVTIDTDELRARAAEHADAGHHGVAHVLYATARELETGRVPAFLNGGEARQADPPARFKAGDRVTIDAVVHAIDNNGRPYAGRELASLDDIGVVRLAPPTDV